jgi:hypothetical protein
MSIRIFCVLSLMFSLFEGRWGNKTTISLKQQLHSHSSTATNCWFVKVGHPKMRKKPSVSVLELIYVQ